MGTGNFKSLIIAVAAAFSALIYTKKRLKKESRSRTVHSKESGNRLIN